MLSSIILALGPINSSELKYVNASAKGESYKIVLISGSVIIIGEAEQIEQDDSGWSVNVYPLGGLESIGVWASDDASSTQRGFSVWPGHLAVEIRHAGFGELLLPLTSDSSSFVDEQLFELFPELVQTVGARFR